MSDGAFTRTPNDTTLIPGRRLRLNCSSSLTDPVIWSLTAEWVDSDLTFDDALFPSFRQLFYIDSSSPYDLVAQTENANNSYCGEYKCRETGNAIPATATVASTFT